MQNIDKGLFFAVVGLTVFGLIMMSSISIAGSFDVTGQNDFYFWRHFRNILFGIPLFLIAFKFPYESLSRISVLLFVVALVMLIITLVAGESYGTAARSWFLIGGFSFQPVEFAKLAVIIFLSTLFSSGKNNPTTFEGGFLPFVIVVLIPAIFILAQPDTGSLMILIMIASAIYFAAGASVKHFLIGTGIFTLGFAILAFTNEYILHRMKVFFDPSLDPLNTGFQVKQALIAIGSGGLFGRGFQNSIQKFDYLPEVQSDTIFAAISEEMGFFRILVLIGVYLYIAHRGFLIARHAPDLFAKLVAVGITVWIVGQAFINIAVNLALFPNTGITLPLISYGGSSILMTFLALGVLFQISQYVEQKGKRKRYW